MRKLMILVAALLATSQSAQGEVIDAGLFTQNSLRVCGSPDLCFRRDRLIDFVSDLDLGHTGMVSTQLIDPLDLSAQGASSAGFQGPGFTPAISSYAYTGIQTRFTVGSLLIQRYEFLSDGELNIGGTLSYSQSGTTLPDAENPIADRENPNGVASAGFLSFQMDDDTLETDNCNFFEGDINRVNATGTMLTCILQNGESVGSFGVIEFLGLNSVQNALFDTGSDPVADGLSTAELTISGLQGDVFYVGAYMTTFAHLGGFSDSRNTLLLELDDPAIVVASFAQETFVSAPALILDLEELGTVVEGVGPGKSLAKKLAQAKTYFSVPDIVATCDVLSDFVNEVRAQRGKKFLSAALADQLTLDAQAIMAAIVCTQQ
jgi:hypothetical protein